jgi:hypothetical protein
MRTGTRRSRSESAATAGRSTRRLVELLERQPGPVSARGLAAAPVPHEGVGRPGRAGGGGTWRVGGCGPRGSRVAACRGGSPWRAGRGPRTNPRPPRKRVAPLGHGAGFRRFCQRRRRAVRSRPGMRLEVRARIWLSVGKEARLGWRASRRGRTAAGSSPSGACPGCRGTSRWARCRSGTPTR